MRYFQKDRVYAKITQNLHTVWCLKYIFGMVLSYYQATLALCKNV